MSNFPLYNQIEDKTSVIHDFLVTPCPVECLIVIGPGGSGKSALQLAIDQAVTGKNKVNISIWNQGEQPVFVHNKSDCSNKIIIFRWKHDGFTDSLLEDWTDQCKVVRFE